MSKFIGRKLNIGIGKETVRGTAVAASYWLPKTDCSIDDKIEQVINENSIGVIEDAEGASLVQKFSEGEITGRILDESFGLLILAALGAEASPATVETGVYDHVFSVAESAQHQSLTIDVEEPNATSSSSLRYALSMIDSLEINIEVGGYAEYTVSFRGNSNGTGTNTPSYTSENFFLPQHGTFKVATTQSGLDAASAVSVKKMTLVITKNLEDDNTLGSTTATDRLNKQFTIEGSVELLYDSRTYIDTIMIGDAYRALRFQLINTDITIGATSNPTLKIDLYRTKLSEVAKDIPNDDLVRQTLSFKAFYSLSDSKMLAATLRNTKSAAY